jgi:hypothetical protein
MVEITCYYSEEICGTHIAVVKHEVKLRENVIVHRRVAEDAKKINIFLSAERAESKNYRLKLL